MKNIFDKDYKVADGKLLCPICFFEMTIELVLQNCRVSWPGQHWLLFTCPQCQETAHVELAGGMLKTGVLDGAPGPCFVPCSQIETGDLVVNEQNNAILCTYKGMAYKFPAHK